MVKQRKKQSDSVSWLDSVIEDAAARQRVREELDPVIIRLYKLQTLAKLVPACASAAATTTQHASLPFLVDYAFRGMTSNALRAICVRSLFFLRSAAVGAWITDSVTNTFRPHQRRHCLLADLMAYGLAQRVLYPLAWYGQLLDTLSSPDQATWALTRGQRPFSRWSLLSYGEWLTSHYNEQDALPFRLFNGCDDSHLPTAVQRQTVYALLCSRTHRELRYHWPSAWLPHVPYLSPPEFSRPETVGGYPRRQFDFDD